MWICFDPTESRVGWGTSISFVVLLYWASITIDASLTNAAASNVPRSTVTSEVSLPAPAHHDNDECRNVTTDNREGTFENSPLAINPKDFRVATITSSAKCRVALMSVQVLDCQWSAMDPVILIRR